MSKSIKYNVILGDDDLIQECIQKGEKLLLIQTLLDTFNLISFGMSRQIKSELKKNSDRLD